MTNKQVEPIFPKAHVQLTGKDGNAFAIMAAVRRELSRSGATPEQIGDYMTESMDGDYDHLLRTAMKWVNVS